MSIRRKIFLSFAYAAFLLLLLEGTARLVLSVPQTSGRLFADEDYSWRRYWVQRHRKSGMDIFYKFDIHDSRMGWTSMPNLRGMSVFGDEILNTNSKGFRGTKDFPYVSDNGKPRILLLGDSFTFGDEVSDDETYAHYLQQHLPHTEIINLGIHGYGHDQMLILLKEEGVRYRPDVVIIGFVPMDMSRNILGFRDFAKPRYVLRGGNLVLKGTPVPLPEDVLRWDWVRPRVLDVVALVRFRVKEAAGLRRKDMEKVTTALLDEMIAVIDSAGAVPVLAYLPEGGEDFAEAGISTDEAYMFTVCRSNPRARCFSTRPHFAEQIKKGRVFKLTRHWEPVGHRTAARAIGRFLADELSSELRSPASQAESVP